MSKVFSDFAEPISLNNPEGIDIEYDARFINVQALAEGKPEQQYGDVIIEAEHPDWAAIEKLCTQILSESKDIRVFCYYIQAVTALYGIVGFSKGCDALYTNLTTYWEEIFPKLIDEDGSYDSFYRIGSIELLLSNNGIINQLLDSKLSCVTNKNESNTLKYVISIITNSAEEPYPGGREKLIQDLAVGYKTSLDEIMYIEKSIQTLKAMEQLFNEKFEDDFIDFSEILKPLVMVDTTIKDALRDMPSLVESTLDDPKMEDSIANSDSTSNVKYVDLQSFEIKNREDVKVILDKLVLYFRVKEPSHPAPLFIERLKRLLDMDFYDILRDISPDSLNDLDIIIGKNNEESDDVDDDS